MGFQLPTSTGARRISSMNSITTTTTILWTDPQIPPDSVLLSPPVQPRVVEFSAAVIQVTTE